MQPPRHCPVSCRVRSRMLKGLQQTIWAEGNCNQTQQRGLRRPPCPYLAAAQGEFQAESQVKRTPASHVIVSVHVDAELLSSTTSKLPQLRLLQSCTQHITLSAVHIALHLTMLQPSRVTCYVWISRLDHLGPDTGSPHFSSSIDDGSRRGSPSYIGHSNLRPAEMQVTSSMHMTGTSAGPHLGTHRISGLGHDLHSGGNASSVTSSQVCLDCMQ